MLTSVDLEFKWLNLERPESSRRTALAGLDVETKYGFLRIGLDSTGARHLMVPAKSGDIADQVLSSGVVVADTRYVVDGQETAFADLVCIKGELHAVFSEFAADLARRFADQKDATEPDEPFEVITACIREWRGLLGSAPAAEKPRQAIVGLRGELEVLRILAQAT